MEGSAAKMMIKHDLTSKHRALASDGHVILLLTKNIDHWMLNFTQPPKDGDISQQVRIELMVLLQQWGHTRKCQSEWGEWWSTMTLVSFWGTPSSDKSHVCVCLCQNLGISSIQVTFEGEAGGTPNLYKWLWSWKLTSHPVVKTSISSMDISWHIPW